MERQLERIAEIFRAIDSLYGAARRHYGFSCEGCADNCCTTKFHHHTLIEELYLAEGLKKLDAEKRQELLARAREATEAHDALPEDARVMCPLNEGGLCSAYGHRPMICRIHGVPYELHRQDMSFEYGVGCRRFMAERVREGVSYFPLNRTMFYVEMAKLEQETRARLSFSGEYRKTTAEMVRSLLERS